MDNQPTIKPGWQTTEFYVTLFTATMPVITAIFHHDFTKQVQAWSVIAAGAATAVYAWSRAQHKSHVAEAASAGSSRPVVQLNNTVAGGATTTEGPSALEAH